MCVCVCECSRYIVHIIYCPLIIPNIHKRQRSKLVRRDGMD